MENNTVNNNRSVSFDINLGAALVLVVAISAATEIAKNICDNVTKRKIAKINATEEKKEEVIENKAKRRWPWG